MARQIDFIRVLLTGDRQEDGTITNRIATVEFGVSDPGGKEQFDRTPVTAKSLPKFSIDKAKVDDLFADIIAAIKDEASVA